MSHLSDKDLDRLSREAAEQFDVEGNTSGWEALEKKLDREMPTEEHRRRIIWWRWLGLFLLILSISGLLLGLYNDQEIGNRKPVVSNEKQKPGSVINQDKLLNDQSFNKEKSSKNNQDEKGSDEKNPDENNISSKNVNENAIESVDSESPKEVNKSNYQVTINDTRVKNKNATGKQTRSKINAPVNNLSNANTGLKNESQPGNVNVGFRKNEDPFELIRTALPVYNTQRNYYISVAANTIEKTHYPIAGISRFNQQITSPVQSEKKRPSKLKRPIEIGIIAGSDFSNVRFKGGDKPGYNVGLSIGYNLNDRWQLSTGAVYTTKKYFAKGEDYKPLNDYWTNYVDMDYLSGECSMWEIPLYIRYNLTTGNRAKWFASTGLSSYLMKREKYEYYYTQNGVYQNRYRDYPSDKKYFLAILHLSAGYEKIINDRFSIQFEPYLKMPLKGVGYGRLQLNSLGTNFSLKYKMGR